MSTTEMAEWAANPENPVLSDTKRKRIRDGLLPIWKKFQLVSVTESGEGKGTRYTIKRGALLKEFFATDIGPAFIQALVDRDVDPEFLRSMADAIVKVRAQRKRKEKKA